MKISKTCLRVISMLLMLAMLLACMPVSAFAEGTAAKITAYTYVYQEANTRSARIKVNKGTEVDVIATKGSWAMIEKNGNYAFIPTKYLKEIKVEEPEQEKETVDKFGKPIPAKINKNTYVFQKASSHSASVKVKAGTLVDVLATSGSWALIEKNGIQAYIYTKYLTKVEGSAEPEEPEKEENNSMSLEDAFSSGRYSNEELIYAYAVKKMGYNTAAAAGLLANIKEESGFRTGAEGDSGRSYGICQWFASRKTRLINWCDGKGLDYTTLNGQLAFLQYELETYYPSVHRYMKGVENSAEGAYDAAYYFCYNFEAPANKASKSQSRGNSAQNTYYPKYA